MKELHEFRIWYCQASLQNNVSSCGWPVEGWWCVEVFRFRFWHIVVNKHKKKGSSEEERARIKREKRTSRLGKKATAFFLKKSFIH